MPRRLTAALRVSPASLGPLAHSLLVLVSILVLLPACADLPPIASNVCGNGVVDPHEDCDTFPDPELGEGTRCGAPADSTRACRYVCSQTQLCPTGWACGNDGICRYSAGTFVATPDSPLRMTTDRIASARFDRDAYPDLLGLSGASVELRVGGPDSRFVSTAQLAVNFPSGDLAVGDLDQDQRSDLVLPLYDGLFVMRGGAQGTLEPIAYSPIVIPPVDNGFQVLPWRAQDGVPFETELLLVGGCVLYASADVALGCIDPFLSLPPGRLTRDLAGRVARGDLQGGDAEELALAFAGDPHVYLYRVVDDDPSPTGFTPVPELYETISLDQGVNRDYGVSLADLDGDGDLDLLASIGAAGADEVAIAYASAGHFADAAGVADHARVDAFFDCVADNCTCPDSGCEPNPDHRRRWPLAVGRLDADPLADVVTPDGVFIRKGATASLPTVSYPGPTPWSAAEIADFNRDGIPDVATAGDGQRGIDFFIGTGTGYFNPSHVDTNDVPIFLRSGDFDGDLVRDLAVGERGVGPGHDDDTVSVLFGRLQGAPSAPVSMGHLRHIEFMEPARLEEYPQDQIGDLLVQSNGGVAGNDRSLARLVGSAQRRLISPFRLPTPDNFSDYATGVMVGHFAGGDAIPDLAVPSTQNMWIVKGAGDARFDAEDAHAIPLVAPLFGPSPGQLDSDNYCNLWAALDLDGDGADELIAVDHRFADCNLASIDGTGQVSHLLVAHVEAGHALTGSVVDLPDGQYGPLQLLLADVDADKHTDLVVVFGGATDHESSVSGLHGGVTVFWGKSDGSGFEASGATPLPPFADGPIATSIAALNADGDKQLELAVATYAGVYLFDLASNAAGASLRQFGPPVLAVPQPARDILASDVNIDGLGDLVFNDPDGTQVFVYTAEPNLLTTVKP
jgi:hypothetical protein